VIVYLREDDKKHIMALYRQNEESFNLKAPAFRQLANTDLFYHQTVRGRSETVCLLLCHIAVIKSKFTG
jgi:ADP-ribose pyrophosphatase YjhB (NUDIX family)